MLVLVGCADADGVGDETERAPLPTADVALPTATSAPTTTATAAWPALTSPALLAGDRIYSKVRFLWIRPRPDPTAEWIGYLSLGDAVRVKGGDRQQADAGPGQSLGCSHWYAIEPRGYVCTGEDATFDADDPDVVELRKMVANSDSPWPYAYGESIGTTVYLNVPPRTRQYFRESGFNEHMDRVAKVRAAGPGADVAAIDPLLVGVDLEPTGNPAPTLLLHLGPRSRTTKTEVARGSTIAYAYDFDADGRSWVMTWDRGIIPKDRVRVFERSPFEGVALGADVQLPIALFRSRQPKFRRTDGGVEPTGEYFDRHAHVALSDQEVIHDGVRYLIAKDGSLCGTDGVSVPRIRRDIPPRIAAATQGRRTWIDVSILRGWLVAYEGERPVYATLISPGRGGVARRGVPLLETASTPTGRFTVNAKFVTATMVSQSNDALVHSEVPFTQNFSGPYALHAAYWHDDWGVGKSGGCVNLAPIDARRIFAWTEPRLPPGWHGVRAGDGVERTLVSLHK